MLRKLFNDQFKVNVMHQVLNGRLSLYLIIALNFILQKIIFEKRKIIWIDELENKQIFSILEEKPSYMSPPRYKDKIPLKLDIISDAVNIYKLDKVYAHPYSSHFLSEDKVYMERLKNIPISNCNYSTGFILAHNTTQALIARNRKKKFNIEEAIFIGGNGSFNYYHWMIEVIPKIENLLHFFRDKELTLLAPIEAKKISTFQEALMACLGKINFKIIYLEKGYHAFVNILYIITPSNNFVFNTKNNIIKPNYGYYRYESLDYINEVVFMNIQKNISQRKYPDRIFLARKRNSNRGYNQHEIQMISREFNVESIFIEDYSLKEQALIFRSAKVIIGPSGSAWTNIIFCRPHTLAISWLPKHSKEFSAFSTLALMRGVNMLFIEAKVKNKKRLHSNYILDPKELKALLLKLIGY